MKTGKAIKHTITIEPSFNNGFIVSIGCAKIPFESPASMLEGLAYFLKDPKKAEAEYNETMGSVPHLNRGYQEMAAEQSGLSSQLGESLASLRGFQR